MAIGSKGRGIWNRAVVVEGCLGCKSPGLEGFDIRQEKVLEVSELSVFPKKLLF